MEERNEQGLYKCCADLNNRVVVKKSDDETMAVCRICSRRHFEISVEPIPVFFDLEAVGG